MDEKYRDVHEKIAEEDPHIKPKKGVDLLFQQFDVKDLSELGD